MAPRQRTRSAAGSGTQRRRATPAMRPIETRGNDRRAAADRSVRSMKSAQSTSATSAARWGNGGSAPLPPTGRRTFCMAGRAAKRKPPSPVAWASRSSFTTICAKRPAHHGVESGSGKREAPVARRQWRRRVAFAGSKSGHKKRKVVRGRGSRQARWKDRGGLRKRNARTPTVIAASRFSQLGGGARCGEDRESDQ